MGMVSGMRKQSLRPSVHNLSSFEIVKMPPAPSLDHRRTKSGIERAVLDALRMRVKTNKGEQ